jgi:cell division protease FtsH
MQIDEEIKRIIWEAEQTADKLLRDNIQYLHAIAKALIDKETIDSDDLQMIMENPDVFNQTAPNHNTTIPSSSS